VPCTPKARGQAAGSLWFFSLIEPKLPGMAGWRIVVALRGLFGIYWTDYHPWQIRYSGKPLRLVPQEGTQVFTTRRLRKMVFSTAATRHGRRMFFIFVRLVDMPISRLTQGKFIPSAIGNIIPIYFLTTLGARSQLPRSRPVLCIPDGRNLILVGSNWGNPTNPGWVYNLRAHPRARVSKGKLKKAVTARELHGEERLAYWQKATAFYPPYLSYEQHSGRTLPIFLLEP
jgi:deazaflavin-dependent oxidoreductase (nitroreductase family)